jgi:hypothetical protein
MPSSETVIKNSLIIYVILFFALVSFSAETKSLKEIDAISKILTERTNGNNPFYSKALSPAQSLEVDKSKSDRIQTVNTQIISELTSILTAFKSTTEDKKVEAVNQAAAKIEPELVKNNGAFVTFFDSVPSAVISRTILMIPKKLKPGVSAADLFTILSSFKHSPKLSDHIYEYSSAQNLTEGVMKYTLGSDTTWIGPSAAPAFSENQDVVLKKCRQLLGWRCITSLYHTDSLLKAADQIKVLFISIYDLENNPDHADFAKDKRSNNQITGSTAIYFVKESPEWILLYGVDTQWNNGKLSFQGAIQTEFKKDFQRFKDRISADLGVAVDKIQ